MWKAAPGALIVVVLGMAGAWARPAWQRPPRLDFACSPAPTDCSGWYRGAVRLSWDWDDLTAGPTEGDCSARTFTADTRGTRVFCEVTDDMSGEYTGRPVTIHIDRAPPAVAAAPAARPTTTAGSTTR